MLGLMGDGRKHNLKPRNCFFHKNQAKVWCQRRGNRADVSLFKGAATFSTFSNVESKENNIMKIYGNGWKLSHMARIDLTIYKPGINFYIVKILHSFNHRQLSIAVQIQVFSILNSLLFYVIPLFKWCTATYSKRSSVKSVGKCVSHCLGICLLSMTIYDQPIKNCNSWWVPWSSWKLPWQKYSRWGIFI